MKEQIVEEKVLSANKNGMGMLLLVLLLYLAAIAAMIYGGITGLNETARTVRWGLPSL